MPVEACMFASSGLNKKRVCMYFRRPGGPGPTTTRTADPDPLLPTERGVSDPQAESWIVSPSIMTAESLNINSMDISLEKENTSRSII
jgi:hypothetical protein